MTIHLYLALGIIGIDAEYLDGMVVDISMYVSNFSNQVIDRGIDPTDDPFVLALGPALFVISLLLPVGIDWQVQGTLGLMAWILVWLTTRAVRHEVVFLLPVLVISVIPLATRRVIYSEQLN